MSKLDSCNRLSDLSLLLINHCIDSLGDALYIGEGDKLHDVVEKFIEKRDGWVKDKILVVTPDQMARLSNKEHEAVVSIGKKLYEGKSK